MPSNWVAAMHTGIPLSEDEGLPPFSDSSPASVDFARRIMRADIEPWRYTMRLSLLSSRGGSG